MRVSFISFARLLDVRLHLAGEFRRRAAHRFYSGHRELLVDIGKIQNACDLLVQTRDDCFCRTSRREHAG
jgi:hypothetical protein